MNKEHKDKLPFQSKEEAEAAIIQSKHFYEADSNLKAYKCQQCNFWHITSN